jgi:hypothetical protein
VVEHAVDQVHSLMERRLALHLGECPRCPGSSRNSKAWCDHELNESSHHRLSLAPRTPGIEAVPLDSENRQACRDLAFTMGFSRTLRLES